MKLEIEQTNNGFLLSWQDEIEEGIFRTEKEVVEEMDDDKETMTRLLTRISEFFGIQDDKYGKENLNIEWNKKGRKL